MDRRIIAVLLLIPLMDVLVLVLVAGWVGTVLTIALVVLTGLIGMLVVRAEGRHTLRRIRKKVAKGQPPTDELLDGGLLIAAGAFLLTPGLVTDAIGFLLVVPPTRYLIREAAKRWVVVPIADAKSSGFVTGQVYTGGFPDGGPDSPAEGASGGGPEGYDLGEDVYDADFEEVRDSDSDEGENGNA
jgi:UPF0716 protein FxsA